MQEDGSTPLHNCAASGFPTIVDVLLAAGGGASVNIADDDSETPLHLACNGSHAAVVAKLLAAGADATMKNAAGRLPITLSRDPDVMACFR